MIVLLIFPMIFISLQAMSTKRFQKVAGVTPFFTSFMNLVASISALIIIVVLNGFKLRILFSSVILAVIVGIATLIYRLMMVKAMSLGPIIIVSIFSFSASALAPFVYGIIYLEEPLTILKIIAIILMILSLIPLIRNNSSVKNVHIKFWIFCVIVFLTAGTNVIFMKQNQVISPKEYTIDFIVLYSIFFAGFSLLNFIFTVIKTEMREEMQKINKRIVIPCISVGACNTLSNVVSLYLASRLDASIQFPILSSGQIISTALFSYLLFKEKPSRNTIISVILSIASIICMAI